MSIAFWSKLGLLVLYKLAHYLVRTFHSRPRRTITQIDKATYAWQDIKLLYLRYGPSLRQLPNATPPSTSGDIGKGSSRLPDPTG